jgi:large subunit ribosomal protein L10
VALNLEAKKVIVSEVNVALQDTLCAVLAEYRGLTVEQLTELRIKAREAGVYVRIVRNTLAKRAVANTEYSCLQEALTGPLLMMLSQTEPGAAARLLKSFSKEHEALKVSALAMDGQLFGPDKLAAVASLPTKHESLGQLAAVCKAPITKMVRTFVDTYGRAVRVFAAVADQKKQQA